MSYRELFRGSSGALLMLGFLARLPYAMAPLATLMLVHSATGSYGFAGAAAAAQSLAVGVGGPVVGRLAERFGLRRLGAYAAGVNVAAIAALIAATQARREVMVVAAVLVGLTQPQVGPLLRVHWSNLAATRPAGSGLLSTALSYEATVDEASFVVGPAVVGLLAAVPAPVPASAPLVAGALLLTVAAVPLATRYAEPPARRPDQPSATVRLPIRPLSTMVLAMALLGAIFGVVQTGVTVYATDAGRPVAAGLLYAGLGLGSALAGFAYAWLPRGFTLPARYRLFTVGVVLGMSMLAVGDILVPLPVAVVLAGATIAPHMINVYTLTERLAPGRVAAAMTVVCAGGPVGTAAGQTAAGLLADGHGYRAAIVLGPLLAAAALLLAWLPPTAHTAAGFDGVRRDIG
ncbi:MFS transporter [Micromonospora sp. 067-2]|uniref:MFS transporter n=1 Tax=Micromonospora sp. 067-2 TaxID=2789270 RepID=UPI00397C582E